MSDILLISESEVLPAFEMAQSEISHYGYAMSFPVSFANAISYLKGSTCNKVLINANNKKIEAYELAKLIKDTFRGAIKTYVFLPNSNPSEGSKFGLVNAEVDDENSIVNIIDKLPAKDGREYVLNESVISVYGMNGGVGTSFITILLAYVLDHYGENSLVMESSNTKSIKRYLDLEDRLPLLTRDKSKEHGQAKDLDWFSGFVSSSNLISRMKYLNLFSSSLDKNIYLDQSANALNKLASDLQAGLNHPSREFKSREEMDSYLFGLANSLKLVAKELEGESFSLFDEVIQLGSKLSKNIFCDISGDVYSPLNKQLLKLSNNLILVFRDIHNIREEFETQREFFREKYNLIAIPVIAPHHYYYSRYESITSESWHEILGEVPLIYPYDPESVVRFTLDREGLSPKSKLFGFAENLLEYCGVKVKKNQTTNKSLLGFLSRT